MVLYVGVCWAIQKQHVHKMSVAKMIMLRWISGNTGKDMIPKEEIFLMIRVAPIDENMGKSYLRQFFHVQRREINASMRKNELIQG